MGTAEANRTALDSAEFIVPEFGKVDLAWFDLSKKYCGAMFRLSQEAAKQCAEIIAFSANFELAGIRTATVDLFKTEGYVIFEIERNTKPTDIAVRYSRERWNLVDASGKSGDNLRPWIKTEYQAKFIPEKIIGLVAEQLKIHPEYSPNFIIRINFKERTFGLICQEAFVEQMPAGGFSAFALPTQAMLALCLKYEKESEAGVGSEGVLASESEPETVYVEPAVAEPAAACRSSQSAESGLAENLEECGVEKKVESSSSHQKRREEQVESSQAKYATYSRSEVDHMLKQQTENITSALGTKISSQQRVFQEAVDRQEKSFAKLSDGFVVQFDQTRQRLENLSKQSEECIKAELEAFKKDLAKELEQYRAQINKTVVPVAKFIEEKNTKAPEKAQKESATKTADLGHGDSYLRPIMIVNLVGVIALLAAVLGVVMPNLTRIQDLQMQVDTLNSRLQQKSSSSPAAGNLTGAAASTDPVSSSGGASSSGAGN